MAMLRERLPKWGAHGEQSFDWLDLLTARKKTGRDHKSNRWRFRLSAALAFALSATGARADASPEPILYSFRHDGQALHEMLRYYRALTGIQYFYADPRIAGLQVPTIDGRMTVAEALQQTLAGTGYSFTFTDNRTVVIHAHRKASPPEQRTSREGEITRASEPDDFVQEVQVSAPRTTALGFRKISPTTVIEGGYLTNVGITNIAHALYDTPAITASRSAENTVYTGGPSVNMLDLRDLGVVRTLVVVNGRRHVATDGGSPDFVAVDMNVLPAGLVERVEVLTTGASVLYGADAVGGLVNVTLKDDYEGFDFGMIGNLSERGDNGHYNLSASFGQRFADDRAYYMAFVNVSRHDGLKSRDRYISSDPAGFALNGYPASPNDGGVLTRGFGRAPASVSGTATGYSLGSGEFRNFDHQEWIAIGDDGLPAGDYEGFPSQRYNWAQEADLTAPIDTAVFSGNLIYHLADDHRLFFEHTFARSVVNREIAPTPTYVAGKQGIFIPIENPFIPDDIRSEIRAAVGDDVSGVFINRRLAEVGNRTDRVTRDLLRFTAGLEGSFMGGAWTYELSYQYGFSQNIDDGINAVDVAKVEISASPDACAAAVAAGCTLTNYFGLNSITSAQADYLRTSYHSAKKIEQHIVAAELRRPIANLPAGQASLIWGAQYRYELSDSKPDPLFVEGRIGGTGFAQALRGSFDVAESHLAANIPVLLDSPVGYELTLDAGLRFSHFSTVGNIISWQVGAEYRPVKSVSVRASYQEANRAPNLSELFTPGTSIRSYYEDPCNALEAAWQSETVQENCRTLASKGGVPEDFFQRSAYADGQFSGNVTLQEERARTRNLGLTFKPALPHGYGDLYLSVDWFDINVKNFIRGRTFQFVVDACYASEALSSFFCGLNPANNQPFFTRDPVSHEIGDINLSLLNGGVFTARGIDTEIAYAQELENLGLPKGSGQLRLRVLHSYNLRSQLSSAFGGEDEIFLGSISRPIHKIFASLSYSKGPFFIDWSVRYRSMGLVNTSEDVDVDGNLAPAISYHNVAFSYLFGDRLKLQAGVENLFDQQPPFLAYSPHNTFPEFYDVVGRRYYLGFHIQF